MLFGGLAAGIVGYLIVFGKIALPGAWGLLAFPLILGGAALLMAGKNETDINP